MKYKKLVNFALWSILFAFLFTLCVRCVLYFTGDFVSLFDQTVGEILNAWKSASVSFDIPITLVCGALFTLMQMLLYRCLTGKKTPIKIFVVLLMVLCGFFMSLLSVALILYTCKVNQIPFSVFFDIVFDLVELI